MKIFAFIFFFGIGIIWGGQTGKIAGNVIDKETGEILPGTNIYLEQTSLGAAVDLDGDFVILNIPPGNYTVTAMMVGYQTMQVTNVKVSIDRTSRIDFGLSSMVLEGETIIVEAERPLIQKDLTATASTVSAQEIQAIPVESLQDVLQLQAGVVVDRHGGFHIRGGRSNEIDYLVDGVSITDPYSGRIAVNVNQEAIQELKVISGTFNAEYGGVMSGVVEVVTKAPANKFSFNTTFYAGDYLSSNDKIYYNVDDFNPLQIYNFQLDLTGPLSFLSDDLSYYLSFRRFYNDGWIYGKRRFSPSDSSNFDAKAVYLEESGDNSAVPINFSSQYYGNFKLVYAISPGIKIGYSFLGNSNNNRNYNHLYKYNPDGDVENNEYGYTNILNLNHTISPTTFYTLNLSRYHYNIESYLYKDLSDPGYQNPDLLRTREDAYSFLTGGTNLNHHYRTTTVTSGKFDITSQLSKIHQVKTGFEINFNEISLKNKEALYKGEKSDIFDATAFFNLGEYEHKPLEISGYVQDKIELEYMTLNAGLRYDYFNSYGNIPTDLRDPSNSTDQESGYEKAEPKHQLSPRLGIAFPISASGVIHASYGHFFQIPPLEYLYINPRFAVAPGGLYTLMGNSDLEPQSTVIYEIGVQYEFLDQLAVDVTGYYKDVRNLLGTQVYETYVLGDRYARYINRDHGNIRGITFSLNKRPAHSDYVTLSLDYTFQVAEGNASDPNHVFYNNQADPPKQSNIQVVPLDWDQTHTLNLAVSYDNPDILSIGLIGQLQSGFPYTPAIQNLETTFENSGRKPMNYTVNLRFSKDFFMGDMRANIFLKIYNLFDRLNEVDVYSDTGRAGYSLVSHYLGDRKASVNTLDDWINRPDFYSEPRKILLGLGISM